MSINPFTDKLHDLFLRTIIKRISALIILIGIAVSSFSQVNTNPLQQLDLDVTAENINWNYNMGYRFTANSDGDVTQLGGRWRDGIVHTVRLYAYPAGTVLATANVTGSMDWSYVDLGSPVTLTSGNQYVVAVRLNSQSSGMYTTGVGMPENSGGITIDNSTYAFNSNAMPTNSITTTMYGQADITFEPCTYAGIIEAEKESVFPGNSTILTVLNNVGSIQWQSSTNGINFSDIVGETSITLNTGSLSNTTYYRTYVTGGACGPDTSAAIEIRVLDPLYPLWISDPNVTNKNVNWNYNMGYRFTADQDGNVTELGGSWREGITHTVRLYAYPAGTLLASTDVTGTGSYSYESITPVALTAGNQYVVAVRLNSQSSGYSSPFGTPTSAAGITITNTTYAFNSNAMPTNSITTTMYGLADIRFEPCTYAGFIVPENEQVLSGDSTYLKLLNPIGSVQWQVSTDNVNFSDVSGATGDSISTGALSQITYYRTIITGGSCGDDTSDVVAISIIDPFYPLQATNINTTSENSNWNYNMGYRFTANRNGSVSELGGRWRDGITHTVRLYAYPAGTVLATVNVTGTGDWSYEAITPVNLTSGNQYVVAVRLNSQSSGFYTNMSMPVTSGEITINNSTYAFNSNAMPTNSVTTVMYGQADLKFTPCVSGGEIVATDNIVCSGGITTVIASGSSGTLQWQSSTDNISFSNISGATSATLNTGTITQKTYYRLTASDACGSDISNVDSVDVAGSGSTQGLWTALVDNDWNTTCNWDDGVVPSDGDSVIIPFGVDPPTGIPAISLKYLSLNNASGITLTNNMTITEELVLTAGNIDVGNNTLTLDNNTIITGGLSTAYIKVNGTGYVVKDYSVADGSNFLFPIGGTANFAPVTIALNPATTIGGSASLEVDLETTAHPYIGTAASYLNKYWTLTANNITTPNFDADATYANVDIVGTEGDLLAHKFDAVNGWISYGAVNTASNTFALSGATSFGDITASDIVAIVSSQDGDWNNGLTWSGGIAPGAADNAVIQNTHTVTLTANESVNLLTVDVGGELETAGNQLNINDNLIMNGGYDQNGTLNFTGSSGAQTISGNITFNNLTINNANGVAIVSGQDSITGALDLVNGTFNTNNSLVLVSNAAGTARITEITGGTITGDVTMQRYIDAGATNWRFLTSPIAGATLADWNDNFITSGFIGSDFPDWPTPANRWPSIYFYDETVAGGLDDGFVAATNITNSIPLGEGVWVWCGDTIIGTDPFTIDVVGPVNTGTVNLPVSFTSTGVADNDGWNMVGNPYPCTLDWDDASITKTNINNAIYIWNPDLEQYASYSGGIGTNGGSNEIASSQGFWVQANAASPVLQVQESSKAGPTIDGAFLKQKSNPIPLKINIENSRGSDQAVINISPEATSGFDGTLDAYDLASNNYVVPNISTLTQESIELSINQIPNQEMEIPVKVTSYFTDSTTIRFEDVAHFSENRCVLFEDIYAGITYDLNTTESIKVLIADTTLHARFKLIIGVPENISSTSVSCHGDSDGTASYEKMSSIPFDIVWKNEQGTTIHSNTNVIGSDSIFNLSPGLYSIQTSDETCGSSTDSIIINEPSPVNPMFTINKDTLNLYEDSLIITNTSENANSFFWEFGDGTAENSFSPTHEYFTPGNYTITLVASVDSACFSSTSKNVWVMDNTTAITTTIASPEAKIKLWIENDQFLAEAAFDGEIILRNIAGQQIVRSNFEKNETWSYTLNNISSQVLFAGIINASDDTVKLIKINYTRR